MKLKSVNKMFCQCKNEQNFDIQRRDENLKLSESFHDVEVIPTTGETVSTNEVKGSQISKAVVYDLAANTHICPVCTGQPGALPTLSEEVLQQSLLLGKALKCKINNPSKFDRKSYFYPDLPMGYQITQFYTPTNGEGEVTFFLDNYTKEKTVTIREAHMECDTAKMIHIGGEALLDFNRAGTPLVEIVTNPDFTSVDEVIEFLKELQRIVRYNNIADADLEKGQMRCDVNISLRKDEKAEYGIRTETKNINSFGMIKRAIEFEQARQEKRYAEGKKVDQETRGRDDTKGESTVMRSKEDALDYRYFPEPDMPSLTLDDKTLKRLNDQTIEIPYKTIKEFKEYGFNKEYINALIADKEILTYFNQVMSSFNAKEVDAKQTEDLKAKLIAKRICGPIIARLNENTKNISDLPFTQEMFITFLTSSLPDSQLKLVLDDMLATGKDPGEIIKEKGFDAPALDDTEIEHIINKVLADNEDIVNQYKNGKTTTMAFFVGQVMKATGGKINPQVAQQMIQKILG
ncbi:MAG: Asp-tRNA(Asn)/Glu-tRNA(Gln) amidotransferase subunit GatB [candidate division SR1 bacterium]|nr:Asp-tRNA(Asn)/Glu-tRNA(Gln) amidotransferase subunit GatB [candidate division SR1 bacterium]